MSGWILAGAMSAGTALITWRWLRDTSELDEALAAVRHLQRQVHRLRVERDRYRSDCDTLANKYGQLRLGVYAELVLTDPAVGPAREHASLTAVEEDLFAELAAENPDLGGAE